MNTLRSPKKESLSSNFISDAPGSDESCDQTVKYVRMIFGYDNVSFKHKPANMICFWNFILKFKNSRT